MLHWNSNSILHKKSELEYFLETHKIDIAAVSETKLAPRRKLQFRGYSIHRMDRNQHGGGVIMLVKHGIFHDQININGITNLETVSIMVHSALGSRIQIVSGYNPLNREIKITDLDAIFGKNHPVILAGDLNSKYTAWSCDTPNKNGNTLLQYCMDRALSIRAPTLPTHFPTKGSPSVLDSAIAKGCTLTDPHSLPQMNSDHNPVVFKIRWAPVVEKQRRDFYYNAAN
jgi:exonuclease III